MRPALGALFTRLSSNLGALYSGLSSLIGQAVPAPAMPSAFAFSEWIGHGDILVKPAHFFHPAPSGFHRRYQLDLEIEEKSCVNWDHFHIELAWSVAKDFVVDGWQLERNAIGPVLDGTGNIRAVAQWNCRDFRANVDLEAPTYSPKARPFELRASVAVQKGGSVDKKWKISLVLPDLAIRYQMPSAKGLVEVAFKGPTIRLVSSDAALHKAPSLALQRARLHSLAVVVPSGVPSRLASLATMLAVSACSLAIIRTVLAA